MVFEAVTVVVDVPRFSVYELPLSIPGTEIRMVPLL
jgi:hypothetical protein